MTGGDMSIRPRPSFEIGDPAPYFACRTTGRSAFHIDTAAGRYIVLTFFGSSALEKSRRVLRFVTTELSHYFDDAIASFFGISIDRQDETRLGIGLVLTGIRYFWDFDYQASALYGALDPKQAAGAGQVSYRPFTLVLDPSLRVLAVVPMEDAETHNAALGRILADLPPVGLHAGVVTPAPVLVVPRVFEPAFCRTLIALYQQNGGEESGVMRERDGNTVGVIDHAFKRRQDFLFTDQPGFEGLREAIHARFVRRLIPEVEKAFAFRITRMERYLVCCYQGKEGGFFSPHRDNNTKGTAHRRFACTLNLNADEYEGGELRFPEFGLQTYRAPTGGAMVFSCSLLHEATRVTRGTRYAFLPFFYDERTAQTRANNEKFIVWERQD
jgi:predicted 2-oxoglutarate/Fe(II)-dependent dioxygenase YbiX/peroxiredoxin